MEVQPVVTSIFQTLMDVSNTTLRDRTQSAELRGCLGIDGIADVFHTGKLRWFGHVERIGVDN